MEELLDNWKSNDAKGQLSRIFKESVYGPLKLFTCKNGISVVTIKSGMEYHFLKDGINEKIKKDTKFVSVQGEDYTLPFDFTFKEAVNGHKEKYIAIIHKKE